MASYEYTVAPPGYRLSPELRLGPVLLQTADLGRSVAYYERVLGLGTLERDRRSATLGAQDDPTPLVRIRERPGATPVPRASRLGLYHFAVLLPDRAALGRFAGHIASQGERVGMSDHLVSEALYLSDPDGLGIEVYADRPRESWTVRGGKLAMATDPLDLDALARAADGRPWTGAPPGTRIGHLHFYVDDLDRAGNFYHAGLGFDRLRLDFPGALFLSAGGYHHHLGTNVWRAGAPRATEGDARLLEWIIRLPEPQEVERAARSLGDAGHRVTREDGDAIAADPWGTNLRLTMV